MTPYGRQQANVSIQEYVILVVLQNVDVVDGLLGELVNYIIFELVP